MNLLVAYIYTRLKPLFVSCNYIWTCYQLTSRSRRTTCHSLQLYQIEPIICIVLTCNIQLYEFEPESIVCIELEAYSSIDLSPFLVLYLLDVVYSFINLSTLFVLYLLLSCNYIDLNPLFVLYLLDVAYNFINLNPLFVLYLLVAYSSTNLSPFFVLYYLQHIVLPI